MRDLARYEADYVALPFEDVQVRYRRMQLIETLCRYRPRTLLEVGCGLEPLFLHYHDFETMDVIEPAASFHAKARAAAGGHANVAVHFGTLQQVSPALAARAFDFVIMGSLLHEVPDPLELLVAARSLCTADSTLYVDVPNANSLHRLLAKEMGLISDVRELSDTQVRMQQAATFDLQSLRSLLDAAGFKVAELKSFFIKPFTHAQMAVLREQGMLSDAVLDGLYKLSHRLPDMGSELYAVAKPKSQRAP